MTLGFYIKIKVGKFIANIVSCLFWDKELRHRVRERLNPLNTERCISYLKKHFANVPAIEEYHDDGKETIYIWVCWFQGMEKAPKIVANCIQSIKQFHDDYEVIVITADNFTDYVDISPIIIAKWKDGIIDNTHFSDILRIHLLIRHGGVWVDSTCLMLAPIPQDIIGSDCFIYHSHGEFAYTFIQSCFIRCRKNNYIMRKWGAAMDKYWEEEKMCINYFVPHLMFIAVLQTDDEFKKEFDSIPVVSDESMHFILKKMLSGDTYHDDLLNAARERNFVQKLTYKFHPSLLENPNTIASVLAK